MMHYPAYAFSKNGQPTIISIPAGIPIGQRDVLSAKDISTIQAIYPKATGAGLTAVAKVRITIATTPTGVPVTIDGQRVTTPALVDWEVGSVHQLKADAILSSPTGARLLFAKWSQAAVGTFAFTTPTAPATVLAQYTVQYSVNASSNDAKLGAVTQTPKSYDGYYNASSSIQLSAQPVPNACFTGWSGLLPTAGANVQLGINGPATITGQFKMGSVAIQPVSNRITVKGGALILQVNSSGCPWSAQSNADWARLSGVISGSTSGRLVITMLPNTTGKARTATIKVGAMTFDVGQAGK